MMNDTLGSLSARQLEIINAAIALLSEKGLNDLSLRDIAKKLGVQAPAIYWHFKNKAALIDYMAENILQQEFAQLQPRPEHEPWEGWFIAQGVRLRKAMLAYPDGGRVVAGAHLFPAVTLGRFMENALVSLESAGVNLQAATHILITTTRYTFGYVIEEQADQNAGTLPVGLPRGPHDVEPFPILYKALKSLDAVSNDEAFVVGLEYIVAGSSGRAR
ncbi:MAG: TetR/AcrR family transcriptional regulator C-terminal domain-containing protein [Coriobacteriales bacterium]|jgi:TetR/AcrR family tetracycline transcriptional repressor|nr:TetR/AcrR family transcriptional regulator C-terminal domain-containing protein [Coriobacteriales bacterium]